MGGEDEGGIVLVGGEDEGGIVLARRQLAHTTVSVL